MTKIPSYTKRNLHKLPKKLRWFYVRHQPQLCCLTNPVAYVYGNKICRDHVSTYQQETYDDIYKRTGLNFSPQKAQ